jgi:formylmethanofuran dehydrogenase subunit C
MSVSKRFGRFKDEDEKAVRAPQVAEDQVLKQLKEAWAKVELRCGYMLRPRYIDESYSACLNAIKGLSYSSKDVEKFSLALAEFQETKAFANKAGFFLSALINNCQDSDFIIHTKHLKRIGYLGANNTKNITVDGDAGNCLAVIMSCGRISVDGNVGDGAGERLEGGEIVINGNSGYELGSNMKGGKITVKGNASPSAGVFMEGGEIFIHGASGVFLGGYMKGGKITVKGNAGEAAGNGMTSGELHIEGDYESLGDVRGGKIYYKGRLLGDASETPG